MRFADGNVGRRTRGLRRNLKTRRRVKAARGRAGGQGAGAGPPRSGRARGAGRRAGRAGAAGRRGRRRRRSIEGRRDLREVQPDEAFGSRHAPGQVRGPRGRARARLQKKYAAQLAAPSSAPHAATRCAQLIHRRRRNPSPSRPDGGAASRIDDHVKHGPQAPRALPQKKVGAAVNSVGNDCASALKCAETRSPTSSRTRSAEGPRPRRTPSGPLVEVVRRSRCMSPTVARSSNAAWTTGPYLDYAAHLACDKLLEKLTGETFDRRKDVWALAACVCEFVAKDTTSFRRELFQAKLRDASPSSLSKPAEGPDASKTAALCAALCIVDTPSMQGHPFGGLGAAWCWLARAANNSFEEADAALPPLVAFLETAAPFLLPSHGRPAGELLRPLGGGVAASKRWGRRRIWRRPPISDLVDRASRGVLQVPARSRRSRRRPKLFCVFRSSAFLLRCYAAVLSRSEHPGAHRRRLTPVPARRRRRGEGALPISRRPGSFDCPRRDGLR